MIFYAFTTEAVVLHLKQHLCICFKLLSRAQVNTISEDVEGGELPRLGSRPREVAIAKHLLAHNCTCSHSTDTPNTHPGLDGGLDYLLTLLFS